MTIGADALTRITFDPGLSTKDLATIPWPSGLAPKPTKVTDTTSLPTGDVLVVTWTTAESQALAAVLTPGVEPTSWYAYKKDWASYESQLTSRSPAKEEGCLARWWVTEIGSRKVIVAKSNLHLATDSESAPVVALWKQMVADAQPKLVITTGTAGGIGAATQLGDVFVCTNAKFNCTEDFKSKPWAQERFTSTALTEGSHGTLFATLTAPNAGQLHPVATRDPEVTYGGDVETVDYFAFADTDDSYGVVKNDPQAHTEEMDDATLPLALSEITGAPPWVSIRNASDPQVPSSVGTLEQQKEWAAKIYEKYGFWTTVGSAIATWAVIADLA